MHWGVEAALLLDGHTVQLGDWGFFQLTINCVGAETEKEAVVGNIKKVNIRFKAGKRLQEATLKAEKVKNIESLPIVRIF